MWKTHFTICAVVALLAIPVYLIETVLLKKGGSGGFIMLDLSGIFIVPYLIFAGTHIIVSTIAVRLTTATSLLPVHLVSGGLSIALIVIGYVAYSKYDQQQGRERWEQRLEKIRADREVIRIKEWWYVPGIDSPREIHVRLKINQSGRFAGHVSAFAEGEYGEQLFSSADVPQRMVTAGSEFIEVYPLNVYHYDTNRSVSFQMSLFEASGGPSTGDISIIFQNNPEIEFDGHFIYDQLPDPVPDPGSN